MAIDRCGRVRMPLQKLRVVFAAKSRAQFTRAEFAGFAEIFSYFRTRQVVDYNHQRADTSKENECGHP
jgi:hypothetical protein